MLWASARCFAILYGLPSLSTVGPCIAHTCGCGIKCGIHTGEVLFGILDGSRNQITGIGRHVNFASRLQEIANRNEIVTSVETKRNLERKFKFELLLPTHKIALYKLKEKIKSFESVKFVYTVK